MHLNYLAFAIPLFTSLMYLEYWLSKRKGVRSNFHFEEVVANVNVGIAERLADLFTTGAFYFFFSWLHKHFAVFDIQPSAFAWILLFLFTDFMWYWYHRFGHTINIFWGVHVVHHQSDDFNFTVSARITVLQAIARSLFWAILPIIGFPAHMITLLLLIHGAYPFFTHTQLIGKLGWLEYIFVTPSHHRVHHACNPQYLDKNYGDVLIVWDKLFGTFAKEEEAPVYGLTKPLNSHSFLWQHFHFLLEIGVAFKRAVSWNRRWKALFGKPDDIDPRIREILERKLSFRRGQVVLTRNAINYVSAQTIILLAVLFLTILLEYYISGIQLITIAVLFLLSLISTGALLEQKRWIIPLEFSRLVMLGILLRLFFDSDAFSYLLLLGGVALLLFYDYLAKQYSRLVLG